MKSILLDEKLLGLVEMTSGLVNASFSLPEWQAVKMIFFAPCYSEKNDKENPLDQNNLITNGKLRNNIQKVYTIYKKLLKDVDCFFKISSAKKQTSVHIVNRLKNC